MEPLRISFLWRSTYDLLPTPANLSSWYDDKSDCCHACGGGGNLQHILSLCPSSLFIQVVYMASQQHAQGGCWCSGGESSKANLSDDSNSAVQFITFVSEGRGSGSYGISSKRRNILTAANDWEITTVLGGSGTFPVEVAITNLKPDIVIWSASQQQVILGNWWQYHGKTTSRKAMRESIPSILSWRQTVWTGDGKLLATHLRSDAEVSLQQPSRSGCVTWVLVEGRWLSWVRKRQKRWRQVQRGYSRSMYRRADKDFVAVFKFMLTSWRWHLFVLLAHHPEGVLRLMVRNFLRWVALRWGSCWCFTRHPKSLIAFCVLNDCWDFNDSSPLTFNKFWLKKIKDHKLNHYVWPSLTASFRHNCPISCYWHRYAVGVPCSPHDYVLI